MKITKYVHSCLLFEEASARILFDPGRFSFVDGRVRPEDFGHLDAVVVTHVHPDHLDLDALEIIVRNGVRTYGNHEVAEAVTKRGIPGRRDFLRPVRDRRF